MASVRYPHRHEPSSAAPMGGGAGPGQVLLAPELRGGVIGPFLGTASGEAMRLRGIQGALQQAGLSQQDALVNQLLMNPSALNLVGAANLLAGASFANAQQQVAPAAHASYTYDENNNDLWEKLLNRNRAQTLFKRLFS